MRREAMRTLRREAMRRMRREATRRLGAAEARAEDRWMRRLSCTYASALAHDFGRREPVPGARRGLWAGGCAVRVEGKSATPAARVGVVWRKRE